MTAAERAAERRAKAVPPVTPADDSIILSCRLKSGLFESHIEVPMYASRAEMDAFAAQWLAMMDAGIKIGQNRRDKPSALASAMGGPS